MFGSTINNKDKKEKNKKIRAELDKTEGAMPGASMAVLMNHLQTN